jgi:hypothetical protein
MAMAAPLFTIDFNNLNSIPITSISGGLSNDQMVNLITITSGFNHCLPVPQTDENRSIFSTFIKILMAILHSYFQAQMEAYVPPVPPNGKPINLASNYVSITVSVLGTNLTNNYLFTNIFKSYFGYIDTAGTVYTGTMEAASRNPAVLQQECIHLRNINSALIGGINRRSSVMPGIYTTLQSQSKTVSYKVNQTPIYGFIAGPNFHMGIHRPPHITNTTVFGCITKAGYDYITDFRYNYFNLLSNTYYTSASANIYNFGMGYILSPENTGCAMNVCAFLELFTPEFLQYIIRHHPDFFTGQNGTGENMLCKCYSLFNALNSLKNIPTTNNNLFLYSYVVDTSPYTRIAVDNDGTLTPASPIPATFQSGALSDGRTLLYDNVNGSPYIVNPGMVDLKDAGDTGTGVHILHSVLEEIHKLAEQTVNQLITKFSSNTGFVNWSEFSVRNNNLLIKLLFRFKPSFKPAKGRFPFIKYNRITYKDTEKTLNLWGHCAALYIQIGLLSQLTSLGFSNIKPFGGDGGYVIIVAEPYFSRGLITYDDTINKLAYKIPWLQWHMKSGLVNQFSTGIPINHANTLIKLPLKELSLESLLAILKLQGYYNCRDFTQIEFQFILNNITSIEPDVSIINYDHLTQQIPLEPEHIRTPRVVQNLNQLYNMAVQDRQKHLVSVFKTHARITGKTGLVISALKEFTKKNQDKISLERNELLVSDGHGGNTIQPVYDDTTGAINPVITDELITNTDAIITEENEILDNEPLSIYIKTDVKVSTEASTDESGNINPIELANEFGVCGEKDTGSNETVNNIFGLFINGASYIYEYLQLSYGEIQNILDIFGDHPYSMAGGGGHLLKGGAHFKKLSEDREHIVDDILMDGLDYKPAMEGLINNENINLVTMTFNYLFEESIRKRNFEHFKNVMTAYYTFIGLINTIDIDNLNNFSLQFLSQNGGICSKIHEFKYYQKQNFFQQSSIKIEEEEPLKYEEGDPSEGSQAMEPKAPDSRSIHTRGNTFGMGFYSPRTQQSREQLNAASGWRGGSKLERTRRKHHTKRKTIKRKKNRKTYKKRLHKNRKRRTHKG